jgi:hypothetical protein
MIDAPGFKPTFRAARRASTPVENCSFHFTRAASRNGPARRPRLRRSLSLARSGSTPIPRSSATSSSSWPMGARSMSKRWPTVPQSRSVFTLSDSTHDVRAQPIDTRHSAHIGGACMNAIPSIDSTASDEVATIHHHSRFRDWSFRARQVERINNWHAAYGGRDMTGKKQSINVSQRSGRGVARPASKVFVETAIRGRGHPGPARGTRDVLVQMLPIGIPVGRRCSSRLVLTSRQQCAIRVGAKDARFVCIAGLTRRRHGPSAKARPTDIAKERHGWLHHNA